MAEKNAPATSPVLCFGVFQVNLAARELRKHGVRMRLHGQPFCILSLLLEKPGEVISREEMRQRLWPSDTFVDFEHSLNTAIKKLRRALGDSAENSRYVETIPRVGYRFVAPVVEMADTVAQRPVTADRVEAKASSVPLVVEQSRAWRQTVLIAAPILLIAGLGVYFAFSRFGSHTQPQPQAAGEIHAAVKVPVGSSSSLVPSLKSAEAHELYLKGLYFWNKRSVPGFQQAIDYFQQATAVDPNYAPAYAGLANSYTLLVGYNSVSAALYIPQARSAAMRALELDHNLAEGHTALALIVQNHDWDWKGSEKEFRRAIELNPDYATAHQWYAEHLMWLGRFDEASTESQRACELDPLSLIIAADHGAVLYFSRQYDRAIAQFQLVLRKDPNFVRASLITYPYVEKGMFAQALANTETLRRLYGDGPWCWSLLAYIYGRAGQTELARRELEKLEKLRRHQQIDPVTMVWAHLGIGDKEEALSDLENAYAEHFGILTTLKVEPGFDPLRSDPRFRDLLRRVGLAE